MEDLKSHFFRDCSNANYRVKPEDRKMALGVEDTNCGACKQRVLKVLLDADWSKVNARAIRVIREAALVAYEIHDTLPIW